MRDLSSPEMQRMFKSIHKLDVCLYIVMLLILVSGIGLAVIGFTHVAGRGYDWNWAMTAYVVMLAVTLVYAVAVLILNLNTRALKKVIRRYVAQTFEESDGELKGGKNVEVELYVAGDKLIVAKQGVEQFVSFDLHPVQNYYNVCMQVHKAVIKYVEAYYCSTLAECGYYSVNVTDAINKKVKILKVIENGQPVKDCAKNPFYKSGYFTCDNLQEINA